MDNKADLLNDLWVECADLATQLTDIMGVEKFLEFVKPWNDKNAALDNDLYDDVSEMISIRAALLSKLDEVEKA